MEGFLAQQQAVAQIEHGQADGGLQDIYKENSYHDYILIVSAKRYHHSGVSGTTVSLEAVPS